MYRMDPVVCHFKMGCNVDRQNVEKKKRWMGHSVEWKKRRMNEWMNVSQLFALTLLLSVLLDLKICKIINIFDIVSYSMYITFDLVSNRHFLPFDIKSHSAFITIDIISVGLYFRHYSTFCPIQRLLLLTLWPYFTFCIMSLRRC
jgi:hypothetical protein